ATRLGVRRDRPALQPRLVAVRDQAAVLRVKVGPSTQTERKGVEELVTFAGGRQIPELHAVRTGRGYEAAPGAMGDAVQTPRCWEGAPLATGCHWPAVIQPLVVRTKEVAAIHPAGSADQLLPGHGVPEPIGRIPASTEEEVAAVAEGQVNHLPKVPLQDP